MTANTKELNQVIKEKYDELDRSGAVEISPSFIADFVMKELDPDNISPLLVNWAAILEFRQLARAFCAERQTLEEFKAEQVGQTSLFENSLQKRYPTEREGERRYVLRDHLSYLERLKNIARLRAEAGAKNAHADALQAETDSLVAVGELVAVVDEDDKE